MRRSRARRADGFVLAEAVAAVIVAALAVGSCLLVMRGVLDAQARLERLEAARAVASTQLIEALSSPAPTPGSGIDDGLQWSRRVTVVREATQGNSRVKLVEISVEVAWSDSAPPVRLATRNLVAAP